MHTRAKFILILSVVAGVGTLVYALGLGVKDQRDDGSPLPLTSMAADVQIRDFSFIQTEDGFNNWEIKAARAEVFEDRRSAVLNDLEVRLSLQDGLAMVFRGARGRFDMAAYNFEIFPDGDRIEIVFNNGYVVWADSLKWTDGEQSMMTPDAVQIQGPGFSVSGRGMEADLGSQEVRVLSNVRATVF